MKPGEMDRRITIQRYSDTYDDHGGLVMDWADLALVWAKYTPISDSEQWRAASVEASATARFLIRYSSTVSDVGPKDRVIFEGDAYGIRGVKEVGRREGLEITVEGRRDV